MDLLRQEFRKRVLVICTIGFLPTPRSINVNAEFRIPNQFEILYGKSWDVIPTEQVVLSDGPVGWSCRMVLSDAMVPSWEITLSDGPVCSNQPSHQLLQRARALRS